MITPAELDAVFRDWCLEQGGVPLTCEDCGTEEDVTEGYCPYQGGVNNAQATATASGARISEK